MPKTISKRIFKPFFLAFTGRNIFLILSFLILFTNSQSLKKDILSRQEIRQQIPYIFHGIKFSGLKEILGNTEYIGYYTDKDLDNTQDAMQFAQAQYVLAPTILDFNNTNHQFILFDCSSETVALNKIQEIKAIPIRKNQFGIILARNPEQMTTNHQDK